MYGVHDHQLIARHNREEENYYDRRLREQREAKEAEERERKMFGATREARHQALQQQLAAQRSEDWQVWFHRMFNAELMREPNALADSIADFFCKRELKLRREFEQKVGELQTQVRELQQQLSFNTRFNELERDLAARQMALDEAKRGAQGEHGVRGARGARGPRGDRGPAGPPGLAATQITAWKIDKERYRAVPLYSDSSFGPPIELRPLFERFLIETRD